ncbi:MAG: TetR/AcrR family transcriptional regulator [Mycobacteriales bacterium]
MSSAYVEHGRRRQKSRTYDALVSAARDLVTAGQAPTVEEAALAAGVSRTTAYRYFANQRDLLTAAHPETVAPTLLTGDDSDDPAARLAVVVTAFTDLIASTEAQQRTMLRLSLTVGTTEGALPLRQGRAIGWYADALTPLANQFSAEQVHALVLAVRSVTGIEARVWLTDVAGLDSPATSALQNWAALALLRAAVDNPPPGP